METYLDPNIIDPNADSAIHDTDDWGRLPSEDEGLERFGNQLN